MIEYSALLGNDLREWAADIFHSLAMIRSSPYFWPVVGAAAVAIILLPKLLSRK